ncbi:MAG: type II toxin-antitoxin system Phd/YefM family antitoxin [Candidatus Omnitrophota bacterium]
MPNLTVTEAKAHFLEIIRKTDKTMQHFIICKKGKPTAVLMSVDEYAGWLETLEILSDKTALKDIREAQKELAEGKGLTFDEVFGHVAKKKRR